MKDSKGGLASQKTKAEIHFSRNFLTFAMIFISRRIGWIFKTESIIMPGFVYTLTSSGAVRGILPLINRFGRSLPPFIVAHWVNKLKYKRPALFWASFVMAAVWGLLSIAMLSSLGAKSHLILLTFFITYTIHWIANGNSNLFEGVLQGKLIPAERRGRLLAASNGLGCLLAIIAVYFFMEKCLSHQNGYSIIFGMTSGFFFISAFLILILKEPPDVPEVNRETFKQFIASSASIMLRGVSTLCRFWYGITRIRGAEFYTFSHSSKLRQRLGLCRNGLFS